MSALSGMGDLARNGSGNGTAALVKSSLCLPVRAPSPASSSPGSWQSFALSPWSDEPARTPPVHGGSKSPHASAGREAPPAADASRHQQPKPEFCLSQPNFSAKARATPCHVGVQARTAVVSQGCGPVLQGVCCDVGTQTIPGVTIPAHHASQGSSCSHDMLPAAWAEEARCSPSAASAATASPPHPPQRVEGGLRCLLSVDSRGSASTQGSLCTEAQRREVLKHLPLTQWE